MYDSSVTFTENKITWYVKCRTDGKFIFRDIAHFSPSAWQDAEKTIANKSLRLAFRRKLREAIAIIKGREDWYNGIGG